MSHRPNLSTPRSRPTLKKIPRMKFASILSLVFAVLASLADAQRRDLTSEANSSTTTLAAGATFTGKWQSAEAFSDVIVAVNTDQNGIFYIDFSPDAVNTDSTLTKYYNTSDIEPPHRYTVTRKYFRVRFTNDSASAQTFFRLQTTLKAGSSNLNVPLDQTLSRDYDSISVRPYDYRTEVALGLRQGHMLWNKFGHNSDVDSASTEVVAEFGGSFVPLTAASTLDLVSDDAQDDSTGTGARSVVVYGIDADHKSQIEVIALNGTTPVTSSNSYLGVNRIAVYLAGSGQTNAGTISVTATTGGSNQASLPAGEGTTQQLIFHTQADHQMMLEWITLNILKTSGGSAPRVTVKGWVYSAVSASKYEVFRVNVDAGVENNVQFKPPLPFVVGEKSCFWMEATTDTNNTEVSGRFSLIEIKDKDAD
jgi:hypothetical protein